MHIAYKKREKSILLCRSSLERQQGATKGAQLDNIFRKQTHPLSLEYGR